MTTVWDTSGFVRFSQILAKIKILMFSIKLQKNKNSQYFWLKNKPTNMINK